MTNKLLILGYGFVGSNLKGFLEKQGYEVYFSTRNLKKFNHTQDRLIEFNLEEEKTYHNIPSNTQIIWTFPAQPLDKVKKFYEIIESKKSVIRIVLSTTSVYAEKTGVITENSPLDFSSERLKGELFLFEKNSIILHLAGIWGGSKSPFDWLNKNLIKNSNKTVNLIHVDDIVNIIYYLLKLNISKERFNLSDGFLYWWKDLWSYGVSKNLVNVSLPTEGKIEQRYISNDKIKAILSEKYIFKKAYD